MSEFPFGFTAFFLVCCQLGPERHYPANIDALTGDDSVSGFFYGDVGRFFSMSYFACLSTLLDGSPSLQVLVLNYRHQTGSRLLLEIQVRLFEKSKHAKLPLQKNPVSASFDSQT